MKKNILFASIIFLGICLAACNRKPSESDRIAAETAAIDSMIAIKPDWSNKKRLKDILNDMYMTATFKQNRMECPIEDDKTHKMYYYTWTDMSEDSIFQHSDYAATWTIKAKTPAGDSLLVDYRFSWQKPSNMSDTVKADFKIASTTLRKVNKDIRYYFVKKGKIWEKILYQKPVNL